jgi:hypothetical protein
MLSCLRETNELEWHSNETRVRRLSERAYKALEHSKITLNFDLKNKFAECN